MKKVLDIATNEEVRFGVSDLPMLVHGREQSGSSLFSITVAAQLHRDGNKLLIFTAYPMAKDEFLDQLGDAGKSVLYLQTKEDIEKVSEFQTVIIASGNEQLFLEVLEDLPDLALYIPFIKNIETVTEPDIIGYATAHPGILSGDMTNSAFQEDLAGVEYSTRVLFSPFEDGAFLGVERYQAKMNGKQGERIISIQ